MFQAGFRVRRSQILELLEPRRMLSAASNVVIDDPQAVLGDPAVTANDTAARYYVSVLGSDSNPGTQALPFKTITRLNAIDLNPGDSIFFQGAATFAGTLRLTEEDLGTANHPITITSYGSGRATINGGSDDGIFAKNTAGISISNLAFVGSGLNPNGDDPAGINFYMDLPGAMKKDFVRIDNIEASGFWAAGIQFEEHNGSSGYNNIQITNSVVHDTAAQGIQFLGDNFDACTNLLIRGCATYNVRGISNLTHNSGNGIVLGGVKDAVIEHCTAYHNGTEGWAGVGIWCWNADRVTIQYCESYDNHTTRDTDGGGFDLDGGTTNSVMQYNYSHDNDGAGYGLFQYSGARTWSNNVVRYNISQNDARKNNSAGINIWSASNGPSGADVYGNSVFMDGNNLHSGATPQALLMSTDKITNVRIRNNIFMTRSGVELADIVRGQSGLIMQGNDYWSDGAAFKVKWAKKTYSSYSTWQSASGVEVLNSFSVGRNVNPLFSNAGGGTIGAAGAYRLQANSPLINAGVNLLSLGISPGQQDYFGGALPTNTAQLFDVGANEFLT